LKLFGIELNSAERSPSRIDQMAGRDILGVGPTANERLRLARAQIERGDRRIVDASGGNREQNRAPAGQDRRPEVIGFPLGSIDLGQDFWLASSRRHALQADHRICRGEDDLVAVTPARSSGSAGNPTDRQGPPTAYRYLPQLGGPPEEGDPAAVGRNERVAQEAEITQRGCTKLIERPDE
jgi:hypothetical protein